MAGSVSQQLEELLNPLPKFADPEDDDQEDVTRARLDDRFDEHLDDQDDGDGSAVGNLRLRLSGAAPLDHTDPRYLGKAVSRDQLLRDMGQSEEEGDDDEDDKGEEEDDEEIESGDDDDEEEEEEEEEDDDEEIESGDDDDEEEEAAAAEKPDPAVQNLVSQMKGTDFVSAEKVDFRKLTEGMDDLGESDEEDGSDDDDDDDEEEDDDDDDEEEGTEDEAEDHGAVKTFSKEKVDTEVAKGWAVKNQLMLWDQLLEGRIKIQKALATANQLPQPQTFPDFKLRGGAEFTGALKNSHKALKALQRSLLELQDQLLEQNPDTRPIALGKAYSAVANSDEEMEAETATPAVARSGPLKRKLDVGEYPALMAKRFADFQPYCNGTLQKWHDKTRLTTGKSSKGFAAFDRNIVTQVEQVLLDKERLLRRTQTRRTEYRVLGKRETSSAFGAPKEEAEDGGEEEQEGDQLMKANRHLKDLDEDIFDDDDFYHQLLRELIERKTSAADPNDQVAMGRQWLAIQRLRSKIKKRVDTKASKGRKVRFTIHSKLVNFMAPVDHGAMNHEARTELFRCLFGNNAPPEGGSEVNSVA
ncbi:hypothetical protein CRUP_001467 [Coryphaenoides rupestris]|nr:hypothetical protein CRUP_001467 [Coryphaenoides rupestris]